MKCFIKNVSGFPEVFKDSERIPFDAYVTYFTENEAYGDFAKAGYKLYSVCAYFTSLPINEESGFTGLRGNGVFDNEAFADYSEFDNDMFDLLEKCPDALVFPRVYVSMPTWWLRKHPTETVKAGITPEGREMMFSRQFREDGALMLEQFIDHVNSMPYCDNVIGYQISGGTTQEWFHFDLNGSFCENAYPYFCNYLKTAYPGIIPNKQDFLSGRYEERYVDFSNDSMAETVEFFARVTKEKCNYGRLVGTFYGYSIEVPKKMGGTHSLNKLLESKNIDFICSPLSYYGGRKLGTDFIPMLPEDSLKLHGKIYVAEADIRTFLTKFPDESRKNLNLAKQYRGDIWLGSENEDLSVLDLRKPFARLLCHMRGLWWFDMWGGWYKSEKLMRELELQRKIADIPACEVLDNRLRAAVIVNEKMYKHFPLNDCQRALCLKLSKCGVAYDIFLSNDLPLVKDSYGALFFPSPERTETELLCDLSDKAVFYGNDYSSDEICARLENTAVHRFIITPDLVFCGNGFLTLHACTEGKKQITLPEGMKLTALTEHGLTANGNSVELELSRFDTCIFKIEQK